MASNPQHEPTMEEILASIRKIISEDSNDAQPAAAEAPKPAAAPAPAPAPVAPAPAPAPVAAAPAADNDVLELTQEVEEPPPAPKIEPRPAPVAAAPKPENDVVFQTIEDPAPAAAGDHSDIFSDHTRKAVDDAFASIDAPAETPRHDVGAMPGVDGRTVEAVFERAVRESFGPVVNEYLQANSDEIIAKMKPLIREWMDEHFPALLEGAVRNEVARVVQARARR